jgi:hypothetical protein
LNQCDPAKRRKTTIRGNPKRIARKPRSKLEKMANPVTLPEINETPQLVGASSRTTKQRRENRAAMVDALNQVYRATGQDALSSDSASLPLYCFYVERTRNHPPVWAGP